MGSVEEQDYEVHQQGWIELEKHHWSPFDLETLAQLVACCEPFAVDLL